MLLYAIRETREGANLKLGNAGRILGRSCPG